MKSWFTTLKGALTRPVVVDPLAQGKDPGKLRDNLKHLYPSVRKHWRIGALSASLTILAALINLPQPLVSRQLIDTVMIKRQLNYLPLVLLLTAGIGLCSLVFGILKDWYATKFEQQVNLDLQERLYAHVLKLPKAFFEAKDTGYLISRIAGDVGGLRWFYSTTLVNVAVQLFQFIGSLVLLFVLDWRLTLVVLVCLPVAPFVTYVASRRMHDLTQAQMEEQARSHGTVGEALGSVALIKSCTAEKRTLWQMVSTIKASADRQFAGPKMDAYTAKNVSEMSWEDFLQVVDFYERSGVSHMALLGGEPTRHSRLLDILAFLELRQFSIQVGTNGIMPPSLVDALRERRFSRLFFFVNSTSYFDYEPERRSQVDYFLSHAGYPLKLAYTISDRDIAEPGISPVLDRMALIAHRSLVPHLQLQVAVPGAGNRSFVPLDRYETLVDLLEWWPTVLRKNGFSCALDCHSIPRCDPPEKKNTPFPYKSTCPSFMIDIGPGLEVWPCFPLSGKTLRLEEFSAFADIARRFKELSSSQTLVYDERCTDCEDRLNSTCDCGCWGFQHVRHPE